MMQRMTVCALVAGALNLGAASAQSVVEELDTDGDGQISSEEWSAYRAETEAGAGYWSVYDADASGAVSEEEYSTAEFTRYDTNADALIDEQEYQARFASIPPLLGKSAGSAVDAEPSADAESGDQAAEISGYAQGLADYDDDGDSLLNPGEFWAILSSESSAEAGMRGTYAGYDEDRDGEVTESEFHRGEFRRYDWDNDGMLSEEEYARSLEERPTAPETQ